MEFEETMMAIAAVQGDEKAKQWLVDLDERTSAKTQRTQYPTVLIVYTDEEVTPDYLAMRIAQGAGGGALRPGEAVAAANSEVKYIIDSRSLLDQIEEDLGGPLFGGTGDKE